METRKSRLIVGNAGGTASKKAKTYKASLPTAWIKALGLNENCRDIEISFDDEKIIISPIKTIDDFINSAKKKGHILIRLRYYNNVELCTVIVADYTAKTVMFKNFTDNSINTAFGIKSNASWQDYNDFLKDRCIPESREGLKYYLNSIEVDEYNPLEIIKKTKGKMAEDNQWLDVEVL